MGCGAVDDLKVPVLRPPVFDAAPVKGISIVASLGLLTMVAALDSGIWVKPRDERFESGIVNPVRQIGWPLASSTKGCKKAEVRRGVVEDENEVETSASGCTAAFGIRGWVAQQ